MAGIWIRYKTLGQRNFPREFFHFFYGYLLPAFHRVIQIQNNDLKGAIVYFDSFGPILDEKTNELVNLFGIEAVVGEPETRPSDCIELLAERWDLVLIDIQSYRSANTYTKFKRITKRLIAYSQAHDEYLLTSNKIRNDIIKVRDAILEAAHIADKKQRKELILLKRSTPDNKYNLQKTEGELHRIGTERRELANLEYGKEWLIKNGIRCRIYEPGRQSLLDQIKTFHLTNQVVGIRGAEFANLIWVKKECSVVVIDNFNDNIGSPMEVIADFLKCRYNSLQVSEAKCHNLDDDLLSQIVKQLG